MPNRDQLERRIAAAQGRQLCDVQIRNVRYLDVFSCEFREGDVSIADGIVVGVDPGLEAARVIDGTGRWLVPGFIDAHVHIESSLLLPSQFERVVLPRGTTRVVCDPHEIANVLGLDGIRFFLNAAERTRLDVHVMLSSCVPATDYETNGAGHLTAPQLLPLLSHPRSLGLAEMMNFPGVLGADPEVMDKLIAFSGGIIDGHCPLLRGSALSGYASAGISSDHESSQLEEAREKLAKGLAIWIREGSVAKDLNALAPLLTLATSTSIGFCTDDRNPLDIAAEGHIDHNIRGAIERGVAIEVAYRAAAWSVGRHYAMRYVGAIAPGYAADLVLLDDAATCAVAQVLKGGVPVDELEFAGPIDPPSQNTVRTQLPDAAALEGPTGVVHIIEVLRGRIITGRSTGAHNTPGVARLSVLERHGHRRPPANGYVRGFGEQLSGAIASSVGHDSHNLIVVGSNTTDMRAALGALVDSGGGFCVVRDGSLLAHLALPVAGLMSLRDAATVERSLRDLHSASRAIGCELPEPFLQVSFLSLPVIPALKLTDRGLVDVERFEMIEVSAG